ncbi:hypothetical protein NC653_004782 [Populus alba x Populus x berolinensis]|uniref:Uncharacterized protein n=1 Tax=Populus alba x Populus x berolinensis TaxID=444605 RepID=A0AAD6RV87_9ROSI|nr:hypothetical protein NC653_004782 [Populus alba x Populus x berolinensis]
MQNLHHVNGIVHGDSRVDGDTYDDQFIYFPRFKLIKVFLEVNKHMLVRDAPKYSITRNEEHNKGSWMLRPRPMTNNIELVL